jgi:tetratricopeptide (TPR) repeat protein
MPQGIDCERCHGPGSIHVSEKQKGILIDTSKYIDYSIVNPAKLPVELQFDICQRCHLQGNAVLADKKSFLDFKPGMHLHEVMDVYLPRYANSNERFIMASHADRLKQSACFTSMEKRHVNQGALRPYKSALTCVTCHNPHISVKETSGNHFNFKCVSCHKTEKVLPCPEANSIANPSCVSCHMPLTGSSDIPHVSIHDHYIRKSYKSAPTENGAFLDLKSINNPSPSAKSRAKAFLQQYERFNPGDLFLLDSASAILDRNGGRKVDSLFRLYVQLDYLRNDYENLVNYVLKKGISNVYFFIIGIRDYNNEDAWTSYRIGEAFASLKMNKPAMFFYAYAVKLAPYYFEFSNKFGYSALMNGNVQLASSVFDKINIEMPLFAPAWSNRSYVSLITNNYREALLQAENALTLDYSYIQARLNKAAALNALNMKEEALHELRIVLSLDPSNEQALQAEEILSEGK